MAEQQRVCRVMGKVHVGSPRLGCTYSGRFHVRMWLGRISDSSALAWREGREIVASIFWAARPRTCWRWHKRPALAQISS